MNARAVRVREIGDARAAAAAAAALNCPVMLVSPAMGAASLGAGWWQAMTRIVMAEHPDARITAVLDCGARADLVQAALRQGLTDLAYSGPRATAQRLRDIAGQCAARLHRRLPKPLDLAGVSDPQAACRAWLSKGGRRHPEGPAAIG